MYCNKYYYSMYNTRFATALHIMTLAACGKGELLSSEFMAGSININSVLVRKQISELRKHGLLVSKEGKGGGTTLAKLASNILLSDIYQAVNQGALLGRANSPNPDCPVGKQINNHIDNLYSQADEALMNQLKKTSLQDFVSQFE